MVTNQIFTTIKIGAILHLDVLNHGTNDFTADTITGYNKDGNKTTLKIHNDIDSLINEIRFQGVGGSVSDSFMWYDYSTAWKCVPGEYNPDCWSINGSWAIPNRGNFDFENPNRVKLQNYQGPRLLDYYYNYTSWTGKNPGR